MVDAKKRFSTLFFSKLIVFTIVVFLIGCQTNLTSGSTQNIESSNYLLLTGFEPFYIYDVKLFDKEEEISYKMNIMI